MPWLSFILSNIVFALLLASAAWCVQRWLHWPNVARILWILVLVKLLTPPFIAIPLHGVPKPVACALGICGCGPHRQSQAINGSTAQWGLAVVWSVGAVATGGAALRRWLGFRRLTAHATPAPPEWQTLATHLSDELSMRCSPELVAVPGRLPPLVVPGGRRARLMLPAALISRLNPLQRTALLLHELIHIRRGDHLVRILESTVAVVYWWLPFVGSIGRQLRVCEELSCDAAVLDRLPQSRRDYARLLLDVIDFASPLQPAPQATAMSALNDLERRLHAILRPPQPTQPSRLAGAMIVGLACTTLPCQLRYGSVAVSQSPATISIGCESAGNASSPSRDRVRNASDFCCPS